MVKDTTECLDCDFGAEDDEYMRSYTRKLLLKNIQHREVMDENELMGLCEQKTMIVHFYNPNFKTSNYMNKALRFMAPKFPDIKFVFITVDKCPKMLQALKVDVLPFVGFFKDGYFVDQLVGFEKLGNKLAFEMEYLENYIKESNIYKN